MDWYKRAFVPFLLTSLGISKLNAEELGLVNSKIPQPGRYLGFSLDYRLDE
jgi:hypothetical protein